MNPHWPTPTVTFACPDCGDETRIAGRCIPCHKRYSQNQAEMQLASALFQMTLKRNRGSDLTLRDVLFMAEQAVTNLREAI